MSEEMYHSSIWYANMHIGIVKEKCEPGCRESTRFVHEHWGREGHNEC